MTKEQLDEAVPKYRRSARNVRIEVGDPKEEGTTAVIMVRITFQRGGGREYYWLTHINDIHQFYPKEMGQDVIDAVLVTWAERMLKPKPGITLTSNSMVTTPPDLNGNKWPTTSLIKTEAGWVLHEHGTNVSVVEPSQALDFRMVPVR